MASLRFLPPPQSQNLNSLSTDFVNRRVSYPQQQLNFTKITALTNSDSSSPLLDSKTQVLDVVPLLSSSEAYERLKTFREKIKGKQQYLAMYSSIFGGITTDPAVMVIPMDDHMVHRGHGVFDTAAIMDGYLCSLDQHLDRFLNSALRSKIDPPFDRENIRRILIQTVSASKCRNGSLRYWLSAGPGDFQLSPSGGHESALYAIVIKDLSPAVVTPESRGVKVITSSIPIKHPMFAVTKSVNYLPNVLSKMEAEEAGAFVGIWLDNEGFVAEGPSMNVAFVNKEKELIMPHFDKILSGCTAKRVLALAECLLKQGKLTGIRVKNVTVEEGKEADEMMLIGSGVLVCPVVQWDEQVIGDGKEGHITQALFDLIVEDMKSGPPIVRTLVPY
ncbi:D-amino-acid transaminase, chloroplastic [Cicer arietinum]|uniref:D-amino-acid transaminase, chloroplastic n=1 Tax=Cicer arietinum TaxID=3827 RepID=A0A1S2Y2X6_CICAR|nr:D-amino-acid transaminase, chloroplastic [Cicer arietinum]